MRALRFFLVLLLLNGGLACLRAESICFFGDSLTAGYGLAEKEAYPALFQAELIARGSAWKVTNAGLSGDTTAGGLRRLAWILKAKPTIVVVALGANDGLRGVPVAQINGNLRKMVEQIRVSGAKPILAGMQLPTNYGAAYSTDFAAIWPAIAKDTVTPLVPFLLDGVAGDRALNQTDGVHPNAAGQKVIATQLITLLGAEIGLPK